MLRQTETYQEPHRNNASDPWCDVSVWSYTSDTGSEATIAFPCDHFKYYAWRIEGTDGAVRNIELTFEKALAKIVEYDTLWRSPW